MYTYIIHVYVCVCGASVDLVIAFSLSQADLPSEFQKETPSSKVGHAVLHMYCIAGKFCQIWLILQFFYSW